MTMHLKKSVAALLLGALITTTFSASAQSLYAIEDNPLFDLSPPTMSDNLPEMGTSAGSTLSIGQELSMGDFYVRQMRTSAPLINDPLLVQYINQLGRKLVSNAWSVKMPFHFYIVNDSVLNAFAFFGGNVVIHSSIFRYSDNESQLASVMAHEISHITQRHLARAMEDQKNNSPLTWAGTLGAMVLATASPQAGMAALSTTLAGSQQGMISFTQNNEQEADRIGIQVLERSGFDPQAMPAFLQKLADQSRGATKPPEMLLTHPLPDSRLSDLRNRANQLPAHPVTSSREFLLAKVRVMVMYSDNAQSEADNYLQQLASGSADEKLAARYGQALKAYQAGEFTQAHEVLQALLVQSPNNAWFLDSATDVDISQQHAELAVKRLEESSALKGNPVLQLNLANAYLEAGESAKAEKMLNSYTYSCPDDPNGWDLLSKAAALQQQRPQEIAARAEGVALKGDIKQAIELLGSAAAQSRPHSLDRERYDARIDQLKTIQKRFDQFSQS